MPTQPASRLSPLIWLLCGLIGLVLGFGIYQRLNRPLTTEVATLLPTPKPLADFRLSTPNGTFSANDFKGHFSVVYFGYTHCPDVCPATLAELAPVFKSLPDNAQLIFVSVDSKRDQAATVDAYAQHFNPRFHGITGSDGEIAKFTHSVGALYTLETAADGTVTVDHSGALYVINADGQWVAVITPPFNLEAVQRDLKRLATGLQNP